jgi:hypothetical protein
MAGSMETDDFRPASGTRDEAKKADFPLKPRVWNEAAIAKKQSRERDGLA